METLNLPTIYESVKSRLVGRDKEIKEILAALKAGRNIVLEGPPGTSKSTILREITRQIHIPLYIVEGSAELTPGKLVGTHNPAKVLAGG
jgi:MoxR-like ATPase